MNYSHNSKFLTQTCRFTQVQIFIKLENYFKSSNDQLNFLWVSTNFWWHSKYFFEFHAPVCFSTADVSPRQIRQHQSKNKKWMSIIGRCAWTSSYRFQLNWNGPTDSDCHAISRSRIFARRVERWKVAAKSYLKGSGCCLVLVVCWMSSRKCS